MFVGESGVGRIIQRTCEAMKEAGIIDPYDIEAIRKLGVIDLPTLQKKANFHISVSRDLFGAEVSTNGANAFNAGLKGRYHETRIEDDHQLQDSLYPVLRPQGDQFVTEQVPALTAINARLLDDYIADCQAGLNRWNRIIAKQDVSFEITQPHPAFCRQVGEFAELNVSADGELLSADQWQQQQDHWLPSDSDLAYINSLMQPVTQPGEYAAWIAPPKQGINKKDGDFEYVCIEEGRSLEENDHQ